MKKKQYVLLTFIIIVIISIALLIFTNNYLMFRMYYNNEQYDLALKNILQLDNKEIMELVNKIKEENISFTIDILNSINEETFNEEKFNIYIDILQNSSFNKSDFEKIINNIKQKDSNFKNIVSKKIIYEYCCSYMDYLNIYNNNKIKNANQYDEILKYLEKIVDYEDSIIKINEINFDMASNYLDLGKNVYNRYDLMLEYFDKIDSKYLKIIDQDNIVNIANIYLEIAEKYSSSTMYGYAEPFYEKAINVLKLKENENINLIKNYEEKYNKSQSKSKNNVWCEAYGCARKKQNGNLHYCTTHISNPRQLTPVHIDKTDTNSKYSMYHKCEYADCNNYASKTQYCSKHTTYDKCSKAGCSKLVSYSGAKYCIEHEIESYYNK